jgi:SAM-dependent MidA family methyltransferase
MAEANSHYYATRDPLGSSGDFVTAPEISQMFGELIGLCLADIWMRSGRRAAPNYVELGPGRGTLAADALRAMQSAEVTCDVHLVETSPLLRQRQRAACPPAVFHADLSDLPMAGPLLVVANEFFDALPIRQAIKTAGGWKERVLIRSVSDEDESFEAVPGYRAVDAMVPEPLRDAPVGAIHEQSLASAEIALELANRIARQGGAALLIDYGYEGPALGDTLQAVRNHAYADPFRNVGECDLTAHVDFTLLANMGRQAGLSVLGPVGQGDYLLRLGIDARLQSLIRTQPAQAEQLSAARHRLVADDQMGTLFKVLALVHPDWARPEGFG